MVEVILLDRFLAAGRDDFYDLLNGPSRAPEDDELRRLLGV